MNKHYQHQQNVGMHPPSANSHGANAPYGHRADPIEVDRHGQRQRTRDYHNQGNAEINRIKAENPDYVRHKQYTQPRVKSSAAKTTVVLDFSVRTTVVLVFSIFLFFAFSLLAVYGIATIVKSATVPPADTSNSAVLDSAADITDTGTYSGDASSEDSAGDPPPPEQIYASVTPSTVFFTSEIGSSNAIMIDLQSFTVIVEKRSDDRIYPASLTKIMTLLVAVENMQSLTQTATVTKHTVDYCYTEGASVAGFMPNETVTIEDLLYGTVLPSGADATMTLAETISGSEEAFVELMNSKAAELKLVNTHFANTSGLHHPDHYSSVHDMALILRAAMQNDICFKVLSSNHYVTTATTQHPNGIPLYSIVHSRTSSIKSTEYDVVGGKTGFTPEAGQCLATFAITADNREFIFVSANAADRATPVSDAEYAYTNFTAKQNAPTA